MPERASPNQVLERINQVGRQQWKQESGYHRRSLAETTMFRFKTIFGATLRRHLLTIKPLNYSSNVQHCIECFIWVSPKATK